LAVHTNSPLPQCFRNCIKGKGFKVFAILALIVCARARPVQEHAEEAKDLDGAAVHLGAFGGLGYGGTAGFGLGYGRIELSYSLLGYGGFGYGQGSSYGVSKTIHASGQQGQHGYGHLK